MTKELILNNNIIYEPLKETDINNVISIMCDFFYIAEPTTRILKIPMKNYKYYAEHITNKAFQKESCLVAKDTKENKIAGYVIFEDKAKPLIIGLKGDEKVYEIVAPEIAFSEELEREFWEKYDMKEGECVNLLQGAVLPKYQRFGIVSKLVEESINIAISRGYKYAVSACTSLSSTNALEKLGFDIIKSIDYNAFEFKGMKPYSEIPGSQNLMMKELR
jgi:ribosomal protein S18 acetylase RimI-like enzyme